jgi:hypothetical protein
MKTNIRTQGVLGMLRAFARYETHGGYAWAAVTSDGELLCEKCVRANYRQVFRETRNANTSGWAIAGLTHSGETDDNETCSHCDRELWTHWRPADVQLYLSDAGGIYIPQHFAEQTKRECVAGVDQDDWDTLLAGPDHEGYCEAWETVCDDAVLTSPETGKQYTIYQDGACWLIEKGAEWDDNEGLDSARIRI